MKRVLPENEGKYKSLTQRELFAILNFNSEEVLEMERAERNKFYLIDNLVYGTKYSEDLEKDKIEVGLFKDFMYVHGLECQQSKDLREKFVPDIMDEVAAVKGKQVKAKQNGRAFLDEAAVLNIVGGAKGIGLDADIEKQKAPEDAFEANPKDDPDWMVLF